MSTTQHTSRRALCVLSAVAVSAIMLVSASCTRNTVKDDLKDTTAGTNDETKAETVVPGTTTPDTGKPMDPEAGTVAPDNDPGNPPAGTESGARSRFMR